MPKCAACPKDPPPICKEGRCFHEAMKDMLGMPPKGSNSAGHDQALRYARALTSALGFLRGHVEHGSIRGQILGPPDYLLETLAELEQKLWEDIS